MIFNRCSRVHLLLLCSFAAVLGCARFDLKRGIPWGASEPGGPGRPSKVVSVWSEAILSGPGQTPIRGFGGRLMFFNEEDQPSIEVEGSLIVYGFDETNRDPSNAVPDRKFVFTEEQLAQHHEKTRLGHSYNFWLPWDEVGGEQKEISLIARFMPTGGGVVVSEQTKHLLPGKPAADHLAQPKPMRMPSAAGVQPVNYIEAAAAGNGPEVSGSGQLPTTMQTTTITIPRSLAHRLPMAVPQPTDRFTIGAYQQRGAGGQMPAGPQSGGAMAAGAPPQGPAPPAQRTPSAHYGPQRSRALGAPISPLERAYARSQQSQTRSPFVPGFPHESVPATVIATSGQAAAAGSP